MADASNIIQQNLLDAKAKLVAQEQDILAQLEKVRKGIESIETTIEVVCNGDVMAVATAPTTKRGRGGRKAGKAAASISAADVNGKTVASPDAEEGAPTRKPRGRGKGVRNKTAAKSTTKAPRTPTRRSSKRNSTGWQSYLHDEFKDQALTDAVETVFSRSPKTAMSSADLIDKIFTADIPKAERTAARDRLLNILSIGVSENKWYRVKPGQYSISKDAQ
jgi:hypothetical protein